MQITLKQPEIVAALRKYIGAMGIPLEGKEVSISFTAGRKEAGLTADVNIEDPALKNDTTVVSQGTAEAPAAASAPARTPRQPKAETSAPGPAPAAAEPRVEDPPAAEAKPKKLAPWDEAPKVEAPVVVEEQSEAEQAPAKKTNSLFS